MPERVPMTPKDYIKAFEQGVKSSFISGVSEKEMSVLKKEESEQREQKAKEFIEKVTEPTLSVEEYRAKIAEVIATLDKETQKQKQAEMKEQNLSTSFKTIEDVAILKKILKILQRD